MDKAGEAVRRFYQAEAAGYSEQYRSASGEYPANLRRLELVLARARELKPATLLDCGCGEGTPMGRFHDAGIQVWGFDFLPEMVRKAEATLAPRGLRDRVWQGDIADAAAFRPAGLEAPPAFDVCLALGVFPHLADEAGALRHVAGALRDGGRTFIEFRNELFSLFTLNRYSHEFLCDRLIRFNDLKAAHPEHRGALDEAAARLRPFFRRDLPPVRAGAGSVPGYDEILSRFHNPFELPALFRGAGLDIAGVHFYHFHAFPPLLEDGFPALFRDLSLAMEADPSDWRGYFMASAFVVEAVKAGG